MGLGASERATSSNDRVSYFAVYYNICITHKRIYLISPHVGHRYLEGSEEQTSHILGIFNVIKNLNRQLD